MSSDSVSLMSIRTAAEIMRLHARETRARSDLLAAWRDHDREGVVNATSLLETLASAWRRIEEKAAAEGRSGNREGVGACALGSTANETSGGAKVTGPQEVVRFER
jgi:hypothetical protein